MEKFENNLHSKPDAIQTSIDFEETKKVAEIKNTEEEKYLEARAKIANEHGAVPEVVTLNAKGKWLITGLSLKDYDFLMSGKDSDDIYKQFKKHKQPRKKSFY